jgi:tripartite-type tricarboxylate transporter receptor subunit TctC
MIELPAGRAEVLFSGSVSANGGRASGETNDICVGVIGAHLRNGIWGFVMKLPRRQFLHLAAGVAGLPVVSRIAHAQTYPTRPVHLIVGYPAGGPQDIVARLMGQWLSERLGQPFVVDNRLGAGGDVGTGVVVRALPDGYTLLLVGSPNAINASLYDKLNFVFLRDIVPVAAIIRVPMVVLVHPSAMSRTIPEFIAYVGANPGNVNFASAGIGTPQHVAAELFKMMTGINMVHVPNRGQGPALTDLLGGQVQVLFATSPGMIDYIRTSKLRALAVTTAARWNGLPDIPTVGDFVPGYEANSWYGIGAPRNIPAEIVERLNKEVNAALADPTIKTWLADLGGTMLPGSPTDFGKLIVDETEKWAKVIRAANIKPE